MARILVIDDDDPLRRSVRDVLKKAGHQVLEAHNGKEGLKLARENPLDLIITDIVLPDLDGLELLGELKSQHSNVKVLAMSGRGKELRLDILKIAQRLGAIHTLEKPFDGTVLLRAVQEILQSV